MIDRHPQLVIRSVIIGILAGTLSGLFGVGGGFIMVPLFVMWLSLEQKTAHATSLFAVIFIAIAGLAGYISSNNVRWDFAGLVLASGLFGTFLGVRIFNRVSPSVLRKIFAAALILVAIRLFSSVTPHQIFTDFFALLVLVVIGLVSGTLSGLLGIGGGVVIVPALILCSGVQPEVARGTSLVVIIGTAFLGSFMHSRQGRVDYKVAIYAGMAGIPAAVASSYLAVTVSNRVILSLFSLLLIAVAAQLVWSTRGQ